MANVLSIEQLPGAVIQSFIAGSPWAFNIDASAGALAITSPELILIDISSQVPVLASGPAPTVASKVVSVAFSASQTAALNTRLRGTRSYAFSVRALVGGQGPYELAGGELHVKPRGSTGTSTATTLTLPSLTVGAVTIPLTITLGGVGVAEAVAITAIPSLPGAATVQAALEAIQASRALDSSRFVLQVDTQVTTVEKRVMEVQSAGAGMATPGKWVLSIIDNLWSGVSDPTMYLGYNTKANGTLAVAGEPGFAYAIEANYNDGSGDNKMELYAQYTPETGNYRRPFFFQINRTTKLISGAEIVGAATNGLNIMEDDGNVTGIPCAKFSKGLSLFYGYTGLDTAIKLIGATGRNSQLWLGRDGASNTMILSTVSATVGKIIIGGTQDVLYMYSTPIGAAGAAIAVGVNDNSAVGVFDVAPSNAGVKGLVVRCKSTQTANAFEVQDSGSTARIKITKATASVAPSLVIGSAVLATDATDGFVYVPTCAGTPTGVPTANTGTAAMVYDTTNNKLCVYNGGWKQVTLA